MTPISTSSTSYATTQPTSATSSVAGISDLQKQVQEQRQANREQVKPVAEQVYISKQAQQLFDTYSTSAANANDRYDTDSSSSSSSNTGVSTDQVLDTLKTVQNRQTARALAEYKQQQPVEETTPKPKPEPLQSASTSINATA